MFSHRTVWELGLLYALGSAGTYGFTFWLPQILKNVSGSSDFFVGLMSASPNFVAAIAMVAIAAHSDRTGERCVHIAACSLVAAIGFLVSAYVASPLFALLGLSLAAIGINGRYGPFWALPTLFLGEEAAAAGIALINSLGALAGFVAPYTIGIVYDVTGSFQDGLLFLALLLMASAYLALRLSYRSVLQPVGALAHD